MNKKTLSRLFYLPKIIDQRRREIQRIEERLGVKSPSLSGMPHGSGAHDKIGEGVPELIDKKNELEELIRQYEKEEDRINRWIDGVEDLKLQTYISLRYKEKMSWNEVAATAGGINDTDSSIRMTVNRYLERSERDENGADADGS